MSEMIIKFVFIFCYIQLKWKIINWSEVRHAHPGRTVKYLTSVTHWSFNCPTTEVMKSMKCKWLTRPALPLKRGQTSDVHWHDPQPQIRPDLADDISLKTKIQLLTAEAIKAASKQFGLSALVRSITRLFQSLPYLWHEYLTDAMNIERFLKGKTPGSHFICHRGSGNNLIYSCLHPATCFMNFLTAVI